MGGTGMKDVGGAVLAGGSRPFRGRERAAVDVDVGPERRSPRYHETCLALESVKESSAAVSKLRCVWLRVPIFKDLEKARRLPVRVGEQLAARNESALRDTLAAEREGWVLLLMMMFLASEREGWVLLKIPRCDIDGVGEGK